MATAKKVTPPAPPAPEPTFTLELTKAEAEALRFITGSVSGDSKKSWRKHTDAIYDALNRAGVEYKHHAVQEGSRLNGFSAANAPDFTSMYLSSALFGVLHG